MNLEADNGAGGRNRTGSRLRVRGFLSPVAYSVAL